MQTCANVWLLIVNNDMYAHYGMMYNDISLKGPTLFNIQNTNICQSSAEELPRNERKKNNPSLLLLLFGKFESVVVMSQRAPAVLVSDNAPSQAFTPSSLTTTPSPCLCPLPKMWKILERDGHSSR